MKGDGKRSKGRCLAYVAAFIVFQTIIILVLALTVGKIRSPKVRFGAVTVQNFSTSNTTSPSFNMQLIAQVTVKNTNFGHFKYDNTSVTILYENMLVGRAEIGNGRARARQTKKFNVTIDITSNGLTSHSNLGKDMNSGILRLSSHAKLSGKVELVKVIKKKKSGEMSCTMAVDLARRAVQDLNCK